MAASGVTYDGVPSAQGGNIFKGISFWVSHRVPQRATILNHITSNAGVIKLLDKDADILIADCARKDSPPNSYSWKFITESIANGIVQVKDRYRIGGNQSVPRSAGPGHSAKPIRTPFTHAEDVILAKWVLSFESNRLGNAIYMKLENKNPRHPWQSWRNRYMKNLMLRGEDAIRKLANEELPVGDPEESRAAPHASQRSSGRVGRPDATGRQDETTGPETPGASLETPAPAVTGASKTAPHIDKGGVRPRDQPLPPASSEAQEDDGSEAEMDAFNVDWRIFCEANGLEYEIEHNIGGKIVKLWELSNAAFKQDVLCASTNGVDWRQVAGDLGYGPDLDNDVPLKLRQCFEDNLAGFFEAMEDYSGDEDANEPDQTPEVALPRHSHQEHEDPFQSSPLVRVVGRKRSPDFGPSSSRRSAKRRRHLGRDAEVPSTPEDKTGLTSRPPNVQTQSPSIRGDAVATMEQGRGAAGARQVPPRPSAQHADEHATSTQDDAVFEIQAQSPVYSEVPQSQNDVTPSQQLQSEALDASPIQLRLTRGRIGAELGPAMGFPRSRHTENAVASTAVTQANKKASRRSLPASFNLPTNPAPTRPTGEFTEAHRQLQSRPTTESRNPPREGPRGGSITECVKLYESLGYSNNIVVEALRRTTLTPGGLAALVMQRLKDGQGVPANYQGVWTDRDDRDLQMVDQVGVTGEPTDDRDSRKASKQLARLTRKHGPELIELRRQFLKAEKASENQG